MKEHPSLSSGERKRTNLFQFVTPQWLDQVYKTDSKLICRSKRPSEGWKKKKLLLYSPSCGMPPTPSPCALQSSPSNIFVDRENRNLDPFDIFGLLNLQHVWSLLATGWSQLGSYTSKLLKHPTITMGLAQIPHDCNCRSASSTCLAQLTQ